MSERSRWDVLIDQATLDRLTLERGSVYGEPRQNHDFIGMQWTPILYPWLNWIAQGRAVPAHVVALQLHGLKYNRMRNVYHPDNYDDASVYLIFAKRWQSEWASENPGWHLVNGQWTQKVVDSFTPKVVVPRRCARERVYVAGPYRSTPKDPDVGTNRDLCRDVGVCIRECGHDVFVPHTVNASEHYNAGWSDDRILDECLSYIDHWATALFYRAPSAGSDIELARAQGRGLKIYRFIGEVPDLRFGQS